MGRVIHIGLGVGTFLLLTVICLVAIYFLSPSLFREILNAIREIVEAFKG